ncbi:hypothetical protein [Streptococcus dysgalactiae]|uniref:hypothetical protein n=1 Tax=Streptococcus dysgalactiae TaxID=1334 RepID=UPI00403CE159
MALLGATQPVLSETYLSEDSASPKVNQRELEWPELPPAPKLPPVPQLPESLDDLWSWGEDRTQPPYPGLLAQQPSAPELPQASETPKEDTSTLTYQKGLEDGRQAKVTNTIDYSRLSDKLFPRDYVEGYFAGIQSV